MKSDHQSPSGKCSVSNAVRPDADNDGRGTESQISGGPYTNGSEQQDSYDERLMDFVDGPVHSKWGNDRVVSGNRTVNRTGQEGLVDQQARLDFYNVSDPLVGDVPSPAKMIDTVGVDNSPGFKSNCIESMRSGCRIDQPVVAVRKVYTQAFHWVSSWTWTDP